MFRGLLIYLALHLLYYSALPLSEVTQSECIVYPSIHIIEKLIRHVTHQRRRTVEAYEVHSTILMCKNIPVLSLSWYLHVLTKQSRLI